MGFHLWGALSLIPCIPFIFCQLPAHLYTRLCSIGWKKTIYFHKYNPLDCNVYIKLLLYIFFPLNVTTLRLFTIFGTFLYNYKILVKGRSNEAVLCWCAVTKIFDRILKRCTSDLNNIFSQTHRKIFCYSSFCLILRQSHYFHLKKSVIFR